ncbi:putative 2OG-Fe(II) oxygenase [Leptospira borgpetersenii]|uniref:putative 2OG-Fe(II) oxygenase n=1 Tax=Leptospira borgpetersenii TaxID=174 RepID=UPI000AAD4DD1|nr:putative 2OG-Fe(II) oxygenase [Leptospira borgpetersenii]
MEAFSRMSVIHNHQIIKNLKRNGYSVGSSKILTENKHRELEQIIDCLFEDSSIGKDYSSNAPVVLTLVGVDARLDLLLEEILTHEAIVNILNEVVGKDYKIWELSARYSLPGDNGLGLHQDAWGQVNLAFAINEQKSAEGVTSFLKGSHVLPRWAKYISWARPDIANLFTKPLILLDSDYAFFINKTWHSRRKNKGEVKKILLFGLYPNGAKYGPMYENSLGKINPSCTELIKRLRLDEGIKRIDSRYVKVLSSTNPNYMPYSAKIEENLHFNFNTLFLYIKVLILEFIFRPIQVFFRIYKFIFKR